MFPVAKSALFPGAKPDLSPGVQSVLFPGTRPDLSPDAKQGELWITQLQCLATDICNALLTADLERAFSIGIVTIVLIFNSFAMIQEIF